MDKIVIIGLGLIGGSIGLALKAANIRNVEIVGVDMDRDAVNTAKRKGAVGVTERMPSVAVKGAQLVLVATPIMAFPEIFQEIAPHLSEGAIVSDVGSTKQQVMKWAEMYLPSHVNFVGGHPMAGKEVAGISGADPALFQQTLYCVVPSQNASKSSVEVIIGLVSAVGAVPYFVSADEHDVLVGGISHLPLMLSAALMAMVGRNPSWDEMSKLASSGFRDTSRLASSDPSLSLGISLTNQQSMLHWLDEYVAVLREYRKLLAEDANMFAEELSKARDVRDRWLTTLSQGDRDRLFKDIPSASEQMMEMFLGGRMSQLMRQQEDRLREMEKKHQ